MFEYTVTTDWLRARAAASPTALALIEASSGQQRPPLTYAGLDHLVTKTAWWLQQQGIAPGDHVAVRLSNSISYVGILFGLIRLGAVLVPINTRLTPLEIRSQLEKAQCRWLISNEAFLSLSEKELSEGNVYLTVPLDQDEFHAMLAQHPSPDWYPPEPPTTLAHTQAIIFTSGTTGYMKGATISYGNHFWSAISSAFRLGIDPADRWVTCLPLYHIGGLAILFRSILYGTAVILHDKFDVDEIMTSLSNRSGTLVSLVPTMLQRLLNEGLTIDKAPALRVVLLGGAAAPHDLLATGIAAGLPIAPTYGLTEACSQVTTALPHEAIANPGIVGRPQLFTSISIQDDTGLSLPPGMIGEIIIQGPTVMPGYYNDSTANQLTIRNNQLHTGDLGYIDPNGYLTVIDRRSDLIVSGGENVYPAEIERVLREHPGVAAACVVGIPDPEWGHTVAAAIVCEPTVQLEEQTIIEYCRGHLAGYKLPRRIIFTEELPLTGSGKVKRSAVEEMVKTVGWDRE